MTAAGGGVQGHTTLNLNGPQVSHSGEGLGRQPGWYGLPCLPSLLLSCSRRPLCPWPCSCGGRPDSKGEQAPLSTAGVGLKKLGSFKKTVTTELHGARNSNRISFGHTFFLQ